jgi:endonuclease YncB( thermonuclease family)
MDEILSQMDAGIQNPDQKRPQIQQQKDYEMESATYENVKPFIPDIRTGKVIRVYDGDTIHIAARLHIDGINIPRLFRYSVRLRRIDSPEMKTKNSREKELAVKSRDALSQLIMGKMVVLENVEYDKYGRILAEIVMEDGVNVSDWMIRGGYAVEYDGGTKHRPAEWTDV